MVAPAFLQNAEVRQWLNGIEPAWTMLDFGSYSVLHQELLAGNEAIRRRSSSEAVPSTADPERCFPLSFGSVDVEQEGMEGAMSILGQHLLAHTGRHQFVALHPDQLGPV